MRVLYLDCFSGISGDMTVAALLDLGLDQVQFLDELEKLNIEGYKVEITRRPKSGIMGTDFRVILTDEGHSHGEGQCFEECQCYEEGKQHGEDECCAQGQNLEKTQNHTHDHNHSHDHGERAHYHSHDRNLFDIEKIIDESKLRPSVKALSKRIFREVAKAEAKVHGKSIDNVHFHEVGAVDSIVDIVGAAICIDMLAVDAVYASPLHDGQGTIKCAHGEMPVPVPAVMEMLRGTKIPLVIEDINTELITPTGMAIVKTLAKDFGKMPNMDVESIGYGLGKRETGKFNALRAVVGNLGGRAFKDRIVVIETNIDNTTPEIIGYTVDSLLDQGALDVYQVPIQMKKNRSATMLCVICKEDDKKRMVEIILRETGTIGVRFYECERYIMDRRQMMVETPIGKAQVKISSHGDLTKAAPEFDDCSKIAKESGLTLREVYSRVMDEVRTCLEG